MYFLRGIKAFHREGAYLSVCLCNRKNAVQCCIGKTNDATAAEANLQPPYLLSILISDAQQ